jgi:UDPglucose 6-dehydrogenase
MDIRSAEMTKYAANAMLATKISFMNEIARICERVGADVNMVRVGIGSDTRIGYSFIYPGVGYGGSCFPKDVQALIRSAHDYGYEPSILEAVEEVNRTQREYFVKMILDRYGSNVRDRTFALWGLAFKPETDDMREAPSVTIIEELTRKGARIRAYDPKAMEEAREFYLRGNDSVEYFDSKYAVLAGADALILVTEWKEFRSPDFDEIQKALKEPVIFDGRNQYNRFRMEERGFEYHQVGVAEKRGRGML